MSKFIVPLVIGTAIIMAATGLTIWNERRAGSESDLRTLIRAEIVDAAQQAAEELEGRIVRVVGMVETDGEVEDPAQGQRVPALRLEREVETAQWQERQHVSQGGRDLSYELIWSRLRIDSTRFRDGGGAHPNPPLRLEPARFLAPSPRIGNWSADPEVWHAIPATQAWSLPERLVIAQVGPFARAGEWWWSGDPSRPSPGDIRLRYHLVPLTKVTLIGRAAARKIVPVAASNGERLPLGAVGEMPADLMLGSAGRSQTIESWKVRGMTLAVFLLGALITASGLKRLTPELLGRFGGSVPSLGSTLGLFLWLAASITVWLLVRIR